MKNDEEVKLLFRALEAGIDQATAASLAGMSERTARRYKKKGTLPSHARTPRTHRTRSDPFVQDWSWVEAELTRDPALQVKTLFELLKQDHPGRYTAGQLRTLQRRVDAWRRLAGPEQEVMFPQVHVPGQLGASDFTHMDELGITLAGEPFPHLAYHFVLTYSNYEVVTICFSETFEALAEGLETALWQIGGVPQAHRTDRLSAAVHHLGTGEFTRRYQALMDHYGLTPQKTQPYSPHENGDAEQAHFRFKTAVDQALRVRGSRDFARREDYDHFLAEIVRQRNLTRGEKAAADQAALRPLPAQWLAPYKEEDVTVSRFCTVNLASNIYSVPSRLMGARLRATYRVETITLRYHGQVVLTLPRLRGKGQHQIDYRHVIWSLVRKPGAFAQYRYRDAFFPTTTFRQAYDALVAWHHGRGDAQYLRVLHLAATHAESDVQVALELLLEAGAPFDWEAVRELVVAPKPVAMPAVAAPVIDLTTYDRLLSSRRSHHA